MIKNRKTVYAFHYGRGADESIERSHLTRRTRRICRYNGTFRMRQVNVAEYFGRWILPLPALISLKGNRWIK